MSLYLLGLCVDASAYKSDKDTNRILMNKTQCYNLDKAVALSKQYTFSKKNYNTLYSSPIIRVGVNIKDKPYCWTTRDD